MAFITADRVLDSSTSTGTGAFVVSGTPAAGYRTFSAVMSVSDTCYYSIQGQTTAEFEVGLGTYSSANTLTRTTVYSSSNANAAVSFSAGTKNVFITMAASKSPQLDPSGNVTALGTPASIALTNATSLPLATGVTGTLSANNGGSLAWQSVQTGNFTAVAGNAYPVNTTSGAVTVTLPASPIAGNIVQLTDYAGTWATNYVTVAPNGSKINGGTSSFFPIVNRESLALVYIDATQGWLVYSGVNVTNPYTYSASYLTVSGGGGGGAGGGGAGAGGLLSGTTTLAAGTIYSITVGAGGAGAPSANNSTSVQGTNGGSSVFSSVSPVGGGGGGSVNTSTTSINSGKSGGSGGGGSVASISGSGGAGTSGQGFAGGNNAAAGPAYGGGGGGGSSAVGSAGSSGGGGNGGAGTASSITGSSVTYAGGGGGGSYTSGSGGSGGSGGGGAGGQNTVAGTAATTNTGGGGGGGGQSNAALNATNGGNGGSGVVILSVPTAIYSGTTTGSPTVTTSGANTIIKFTASGSYTA